MSFTSSKIINLIKDNSVPLMLKKLIPPLTNSSHKGQMGRIAVIGGSKDYTGAPFYASMASLRFGGDLSYVFCEKSAAIAIKSYSPEIMVTPFYDFEAKQCSATAILGILPRIHALVIGPGLGREETIFDTIAEVITAAIASNVPIVIDADGLYMLEQGRLGLVKGYQRCILTPNRVEFERLVQHVMADLRESDPASAILTDLSSADEERRLRAFSRSLNNVTVILKGPADLISDGHDEVLRVEEEGSPRRCGGQGDLLAGALGVSAHWAFSSDQLGGRAGAWACVLASLVIRRAAKITFNVHKRATTTPDILEHIGSAFEQIAPAV